MPRYNFNVKTRVDTLDEEGIEFASLGEAKAFAEANAHFMVAEEMRHERRFSPDHAIEITSANGTLLHSVR